jgi:hypothetical protein
VDESATGSTIFGPDRPIAAAPTDTFAALGRDGSALATDAASRAPKSQSRLEHIYRRAMSALITADDVREGRPNASCTAASPALATTCARSRSASGTHCSSKADWAKK